MNVAIKGHSKRGKEIIEILEMLGGVNRYAILDARQDILYAIRTFDNFIIGTYPTDTFVVFTLEEFLEKFPYKVGDKVSSKYLKNYKIVKMEWEDTNNRVIYKLQGMGWYSSDELQPYKEETMDKANKVVFDTNAQCCDIMNHLIKEKAMEEIKIDIPKGYEFAGVDDDNQQVVFTKIGYHYPNTYEECFNICFGNKHHIVQVVGLDGLGDNKELFESFIKLKICRDAYWKIAGAEMGLDKPWKPDFTNNDEERYGIYTLANKVERDFCGVGDVNMVLSFPTEEMRDAFYENFKELIEQCKELL